VAVVVPPHTAIASLDGESGRSTPGVDTGIVRRENSIDPLRVTGWR